MSAQGECDPRLGSPHHKSVFVAGARIHGASVQHFCLMLTATRWPAFANGLLESEVLDPIEVLRLVAYFHIATMEYLYRVGLRGTQQLMGGALSI
jgi:hypothetical protein